MEHQESYLQTVLGFFWRDGCALCKLRVWPAVKPPRPVP